MVLLNSPIEVVARALADVDGYSNWNTKLGFSRRLHSLTNSTDIAQLSLKSWIGNWDCVLMRHYSSNKQNVRLICASIPCTNVKTHFNVRMLAFDLKQIDSHTVVRCFTQIKSKRFQEILHFSLIKGFNKLADYLRLIPLESLKPEVEISTEEKLKLARAVDVGCSPYRVKDLDTGEYYLSVPQENLPIDLTQKLTTQQQPIFDAFKAKFPELDDNTLYRFLKSRNFVLRKAEEILKEVLEWRERVRPDLITAQDVVTEMRRGFIFRYGNDRQDRPIILFRACRYLPKEMQLEDVERYLLYLLESTLRELPPHVDAYSMIFDVKDAAYRNFSLSHNKYLLTLFQNYYPERLARAFIINSSWAIKIFWKSVKPFLHQDSIDKVSFLETHELHILKDFIEPSQLLQEYGGTATLSD
mmetsp:Transcript_12214/g.23169  ORF Transcript_12214/g.23169 Transcript_12214/m.23169 type:complete len:414 (-) Transcript_12214:1697-2938(-)